MKRATDLVLSLLALVLLAPFFLLVALRWCLTAEFRFSSSSGA